MPKKTKAIQRHHITYEPEWVVYVYRGEHHILTLLQLYCKKEVSKGLITALRHFIKTRAKCAKSLRKEYNERQKS